MISIPNRTEHSMRGSDGTITPLKSTTAPMRSGIGMIATAIDPK